ncbi:hypothetical protein ABEB36_002547 [Hypothenemus hampei]|uniref:MIP18 family-like domain-containing protein n=1 Tax=Hypothenemus hampei TaxID=57062 RepID=A0ABD1F648_HYPHA
MHPNQLAASFKYSSDPYQRLLILKVVHTFFARGKQHQRFFKLILNNYLCFKSWTSMTELEETQQDEFSEHKDKHKDKLEVETPKDPQEIKDMIFDLLRNIKDPEKPNTLEELNVIYEDGIFIKEPTGANINVVRVEFNPTVPHCSLATLIGLCIRIKLQREMPFPIKLDIYIKAGAHTTEHEINKQVNDKERIAAAMENPNLKEIVECCIREED